MGRCSDSRLYTYTRDAGEEKKGIGEEWNLGTWESGNMEIWEWGSGNMGIWEWKRSRDLGTWESGSGNIGSGIWEHGNLGVET